MTFVARAAAYTVADPVLAIDLEQCPHWLKVAKARGWSLPPAFQSLSWREAPENIEALKEVVADYEGASAWRSRVFDEGLGNRRGREGLPGTYVVPRWGLQKPGLLLVGLSLTSLVTQWGEYKTPRAVTYEWMNLQGGGQIAWWLQTRLIDRFDVGRNSVQTLIDAVNAKRYKPPVTELVVGWLSKLPSYDRGWYAYRWFGSDSGKLPAPDTSIAVLRKRSLADF